MDNKLGSTKQPLIFNEAITQGKLSMVLVSV